MSRHRTRTAAAAVLSLACLGLAACGGSSSAGNAAVAGTSGPGNDGVSAAAAAVAKYRPGASSTDDIPAIKGVDQLKGKTVMYMPIALTVPFFQAAIHGLTDSLGVEGVTLQTCDAKANPSAAAACLDQAVKQHVGAVVTDSVPKAFAAQAFAALEAAHIPVVTVDNGEGTPSATQAYVGGPASTLGARLTSDWVIADSQGKADVLLLEIIDSPASKGYVEEGALPEFKAKCSGCKVTVEKSTTSDLQNVPSLISTALVRDPNISYVYAEFDIDEIGRASCRER